MKKILLFLFLLLIQTLWSQTSRDTIAFNKDEFEAKLNEIDQKADKLDSIWWNYKLSLKANLSYIDWLNSRISNDSTLLKNSYYNITQTRNVVGDSIANEKSSRIAADNLKADKDSPVFTTSAELPSNTTIGTVSSTELGYLDNVSSPIQSQLNTKASMVSPTFSGTVTLPSTTTIGSTTAGELGYVHGLTSSIQNQIDTKLTSNFSSLNNEDNPNGDAIIPIIAAGESTPKYTALNNLPPPIQTQELIASYNSANNENFNRIDSLLAAFKARQDSLYAQVQSFLPIQPNITAVTNFAVALANNDSAHITWTTVSPADSFRLYRDGYWIASVGSGVSSYYDPDLAVGTYSYYSRTLYSSNLSDPTLVAYLTVPNPPATIIAANYYIDGLNGNDANSGTTPATAWKTTSKIANTTMFSPGNIIAIRDSIRYEGIVFFTDYGTAGNQITLTNYYGSATGRKPLLKASKTVTTFEVYSGNVWRAPYTATAVNAVWFETDVDDPTETYWGIPESSIGNLNADMEWYFTSNYLYVYSTTDPDTRWQYVEANSRSSWNEAACLWIDQSYVTVQNLACRYASRSGSNASAGIWLGNNQSHHIIVQDNEVSFNGNTTQTAHGIISNNSSYENIIRRNKCFQNDDHGIYVWNGRGSAYTAYNILIDSNIVYDNWHSQIDINTGNGSKIDSVVEKRNVLANTSRLMIQANNTNMEPDGFFIAGQTSSSGAYTHRVHVFNNTLINIKAGAIDLDGESNGSAVDNTYIYENTFYDDVNGPSVDGHRIVSIYQNAGHVTFKNNIIYSTYTKGLLRLDYTTNKVLDNNLYYWDASVQYPFHHSGTNVTSLTNWRTWTGQETHSKNVDPEFVTPGTDFNLQGTSQAINNGATLGAPYNIDINGTSRPQGAGYDMGSNEYIE